MPRGNPNISKYSYTNMDNVLTTEEDNKNYIGLIQESFEVQKPDLNNPQQIDNAINAYFERCARHNIKPGNMGLYNALGLTRQEVNEYLNGRRKANPYLLDTLKKVKASMAEYREVLGAQNKLSPPVLIFWQKNHDGFEDVQRVDVAAVDNLAPDKSPEQIAQEVINDIPDD